MDLLACAHCFLSFHGKFSDLLLRKRYYDTSCHYMSTEPFLGTCARDTLWADDLVEEILAEGEALSEIAEKFSVQCADVLSFCSESY